VITEVPAKGVRSRRDLLMKSYERLFRARVPLPPRTYDKITVSDPWTYAELGEAVEAWGFRCIQDEHRFIDREAIARRWFAEEYTPIVRMLAEAGLLGRGTDAEAYLRVAHERYRLMRTHDWNEDIVQRLRQQIT
jgi:hypothetical protein